MVNQRPLSALEHTVETFNQLAASYNIVTISRVRGRLDGEVLEKAIYFAQQHHPLLNYCIDGQRKGQPQLQPQSLHPIPVVVSHSQEPSDWQDAVSAELNTKIESHRQLMRVVLVTQPNTQTHHLITTLHHAIADGLSALRLHQDLLTFCQQILTGQMPADVEPLPVLPMAEALLPAAHQGRMGKLKGTVYLLKIQLKYLYYRPKTLRFEQTVAIADRRCGFLRRELSPEITTQLVQRCRQEQTTVQGVLCAAMLRSVANHLRTPQCPTVNAVSRTYTDLRRRLSPPLSHQPLGFFASGVASFHCLAPEASLWDLARDAKHQIQRELANGGDFYTVRQARNLVAAMLARPNQAPVTVEITNVGQVDLPATYGPLVLEDISYCVPQAVFGGVYTATAITFRDTLVLNFMYSMPALSESAIAALSQDTIQQIVSHL